MPFEIPTNNPNKKIGKIFFAQAPKNSTNVSILQSKLINSTTIKIKIFLILQQILNIK